MRKITVVTSNPNKLKEIQAITGTSIELTSKAIDLPEIQSLDLNEIVTDKVKRAYAHINSPVIVEDVSAGLDGLAGLPGPFYKFFREQLGDTILVKMSSISENNNVTVKCLAAFFDGRTLLFGEGVIKGTVVQPRGKNGFGFDPVIVPIGESRTMAEMTSDEKNQISHRGLAFKDLFNQL